MSADRVTQLPSLPIRPRDGHKGTFGKVLVVAGSRGMSGAACLTGLGALRSGAGLVTVASPLSAQPLVAAFEPSYLTVALPEDDSGRIPGEALGRLNTLIVASDAVAIGPGLGRSSDLNMLVWELFLTVEKPMIVDADGLNALASATGAWRKRTTTAPRILTPHPGEFARLIARGIDAVQADRTMLACEFARAHDVVVVLKGSETVITDGHKYAINTTGNSGMATGGTGDVLTGLIAGLCAGGMSAFNAAQLGAHVHGLAGDLAAGDLSEPGLIASDLPRYIAAAWKNLIGG